MNADMRAAGLALGGGFDLVHSHDWLVADAARKLARRWQAALARHRPRDGVRPPPGLGRTSTRSRTSTAWSSGWSRAADRVITCSAYMREHVADAFGIAADRITVIPNGIDPTDLQPMADLPRLRARFAAPDEKLCCSSAGSCTRRASTSRWRRCRS